MRGSLICICTVYTTLYTTLAAATPQYLDHYQKAVDDSSRPTEAQSRDAYRKPMEVLKFTELKPGARVLELAPGGGYYTAILSRVLGDSGVVQAVDPERLFEVFEQGRDGFRAYRQADPRATDPNTNIRYSTEYFDNIKFDVPLDQIWMVLYYHDTLWTGEDRAAMNAAFFDALKPGGRYLVIDHHALAGAPASVGRDLHRMDKSIAIREIQAAGFALVKESDVLSDASDPKNDSVFSEHRRGHTDRFMLLFEKPIK